MSVDYTPNPLYLRINQILIFARSSEDVRAARLEVSLLR